MLLTESCVPCVCGFFLAVLLEHDRSFAHANTDVFGIDPHFKLRSHISHGAVGSVQNQLDAGAFGVNVDRASVPG